MEYAYLLVLGQIWPPMPKRDKRLYYVAYCLVIVSHSKNLFYIVSLAP